jgi:hypothetical protein
VFTHDVDFMFREVIVPSRRFRRFVDGDQGAVPRRLHQQRDEYAAPRRAEALRRVDALDGFMAYSVLDPENEGNPQSRDELSGAAQR